MNREDNTNMTIKMRRYDITRLAATTPSSRGLRSHLEAIQTGPCSDSIDDAARSENLAVVLQAIEATWTQGQQVERARNQIVNGRYGVCENCDDPIAKARLKAVPWATLCVDCQRQQESSKKPTAATGLASVRDGFERRFDDAA